jgi:hypothetical protein
MDGTLDREVTRPIPNISGAAIKSHSAGSPDIRKIGAERTPAPVERAM